jgi:hypothetical protein
MTAATEYAKWKMGCVCSEAARQFGKAWLRDPAIPLEDRYRVALALLTGPTLH